MYIKKKKEKKKRISTTRNKRRKENKKRDKINCMLDNLLMKMFNWKITHSCYLPVSNSVATGQEKNLSAILCNES